MLSVAVVQYSVVQCSMQFPTRVATWMSWDYAVYAVMQLMFTL